MDLQIVITPVRIEKDNVILKLEAPWPLQTVNGEYKFKVGETITITIDMSDALEPKAPIVKA